MSEVSDIIQRISSQLKSFPVLTSFAFERDYNWIPFTAFARNNYPLAFGLVIGYLLFIVVGTMIMARQEKPFDLRLILAGWNALLSIFSFIGMCKTVWDNMFIVAVIHSNCFIYIDKLHLLYTIYIVASIVNLYYITMTQYL